MGLSACRCNDWQPPAGRPSLQLPHEELVTHSRASLNFHHASLGLSVLDGRGLISACAVSWTKCIFALDNELRFFLKFHPTQSLSSLLNSHCLGIVNITSSCVSSDHCSQGVLAQHPWAFPDARPSVRHTTSAVTSPRYCFQGHIITDSVDKPFQLRHNGP